MLGVFPTRLCRQVVMFLSLVIGLGITSFRNPEIASSQKTRVIATNSIVSGTLKPPAPETAPGYPNAQTLELHKIFLPLVSGRHESPSLFGVQTYFTLTDDAPGLRHMVDLQTTWVRKPIVWKHIEPVDTTPEYYNWAAYDAQYLTASANGLKIIATLQGNPSWAAEDEGGPVYPEHEDDFLEFVRAMVERYDGDGYQDAPGSSVVEYWEFYNEPDNGNPTVPDSGFGSWGHLGAEYADLLAQAYPVIKAANPSAFVLIGGIAYDNFSDQGLGSFERKFIDDFLGAGGGNYIDFFNFHYYPVFAPNWAPYGPDLIGKTNFLRAKLASYGIIDKPIAITEIGIGSDASGGWSDETQSRYVLQAFSRAMAADIELMIWFALNDLPPHFFFGLTDTYFVPKPSYTVYKTMTAQFANAVYQHTLNTSELGSSVAEGYAYQRGQEIMYVVWTNDDSPAQMTIQASNVTKVDKFGVFTIILDIADGVADGLVTVNYDGSPVYLIFTSET